MSDLQFDKVEPAPSSSSSEPEAAAALTCAVCKRAVQGSYYEVNGNIVDATCKTAVDRAREDRGTPTARLLAATALGLGAAVVGAAIYWGITTATGWNIGLVAIAVGYLVGAAVQRGSRKMGGRGYQVLAVALTYVAVAWSYLPPMVTELGAKNGSGPGTMVFAFLLSFVMPIAEPVMSLPGGLLSLLITFFGLSRAWRMNAKPPWNVKGPFTAP